MNNLVSQGVIDVHVPLMDIPGSYSAQFEHVCPSFLHPLFPICHGVG